MKGLSHKDQFGDALIFIFRNAYAAIYHIRFLSVKTNAYFLRNTLLTLVIFYVFQEFYNLRMYIRVMKDIITDFSCFS